MLFTTKIASRLARMLVVPVRTATKRSSGGKSANNNTAGRRLGPKAGENEFVKAGEIIWRQRGTKWFPGENAGIGRDHTIFAKEPGFVRYYRDPFHAKRRFVGVALQPQWTLPTPHFEPRRRRLGLTPIDNVEVSEFERAFLTRKETKSAALREEVARQRANKRQKRGITYRKVLELAGLREVPLRQLNRLEMVYQYMCGGMSSALAKSTVDEILVEDMRIAAQNQSASTDLAAEIHDFKHECAQVDALVSFSPNAELVSVTELPAEKRQLAIDEITKLAAPYLNCQTGTPKEIVDQITAILDNCAAISRADAAHLRARHLRRPQPVLLTPERALELETKAKNGEGEIRSVWDYAVSGVKRYFVPEGAKLIFK